MIKKKMLLLLTVFVLSLSTFIIFQNFTYSTNQRKSISVTEYGAQGDGVTDAGPAIQAAINAAIALGPNVEVYFPAGTYRLACPGAGSGVCLSVGNANNLFFRGAGVNQTRFLIGNRFKALLDVSNSSDVAISDFSVDYAELPFTQGSVTITNPSTNALQFVIDANYPQPSFLTADLLKNTFAMAFDNNAHLKANAPHAFMIKSLTQVNQNTWHVSLDTVQGIAPGDKFVLQIRGASLFNFYRNHNLQFKKVLVLASPGLVSAWVQNDGNITIDGLEIRRSQGRMISSTADAIHMADNNAKAVVRNCYFEGMADDAINTRSTAFPVIGMSSNSNLTFSDLGVKGFAVGQTLQAVDTSTQLPRGIARIVQMRSIGGNTTVALDQAIPNVKVGDILFNADFAIPNLVVRDNTFSNFRGIFRIRSRGAVFTNNSILDPENAQVFISADIAPSWVEGPSLVNSMEGVYFNSNYVQNGSFKLLQVNYQNTGVPPLSGEAALKTHPSVFDPIFYRSLYSDLAYMNVTELKNHWINSGIREGRRGSVEFFALEYLNLYPDLRNSFGASNYEAALLHYVQSGNIIENRMGSMRGNSLVYNVAVYRAMNLDLSGMSVSQLGLHWLNNGIGEGRRAHLKFSAPEYLSIYPDLRKGYGTTNYAGAISHYVSVGANVENRSGTTSLSPLVFNASTYAVLNSDLGNGGLDELQLAVHWMLHGLREGRQASTTFSSRAYLNRYADLANGFGATNYYMAIQHYVISGKAEGRNGKP